MKVSELREYLKGRIPEYMIPSVYVEVEEMPLTPNGKIDRKRLPEVEKGRMGVEESYVGPRTEEEEKLAEIWGEVLGVEKVGVKDNFFELGGDSIMTIQVISKANRAGLKLTPRQIFERQTVEELAEVVEKKEEGEGNEAEQGLVEGKIELTPIMRWYFEQEQEEPWHYNQAVMLEVREEIDGEAMRETVRKMMEQHDALRLRFRRGEGGEWEGEIVGMGEEIPYEEIDLSGMSGEERREEQEVHAGEVQESLDLEKGPMMRVVYYRYGEGEGGRLLWVIHHLAVDGVSWRILLEDMQQAYRQKIKGQEIELPAKTTSYLTWANNLVTLATNSEIQQDIDYWISSMGETNNPIPTLKPNGLKDESILDKSGFS